MTNAARRALGLIGLLAIAGSGWACSSDETYHPGTPLTLAVGSVFPAGTQVRDQYSGATATVTAGGSVTLTPDASGVVLLEQDGAAPTPFDWKDATVYFALTDRFYNGASSTAPAGEVGAWHGGNWKGLTAKLDYIQGLGATAIWISPIVEQVHGWVSGGSGAFKYYGYHGYWALDFTRLDSHFGTQADLQELVDQAHLRGIRVLVDVVLNHPGYATGDDLLAWLPELFFDPTGNTFRSFTPSGSRGYDAWNDLVNYQLASWTSWWTPKWIRAGFPGFDPGGTDEQTKQLTFLPDFKTESGDAAGRPPFFARKADTGFTAEISGYTVRQYLVKWHTDWLRQFGFDGFRCDTALNVEVASWKALKDEAVPKLRAWKTANPGKKLDDSDFWMTGEVWGHNVTKDSYFDAGGFDSVINFSFHDNLAYVLGHYPTLAAGVKDLDPLYSSYAAAISTDPTFDVLSYLSSHDTHLFFAELGYDAARLRQAATALLLAPGGVQIFYGDESGRQLGDSKGDDAQGVRSDMNWGSADAAILAHWQKLGAFRKRHAAIGAGGHLKLASPAGTYAFARKLDQGGVKDAVVVVLTAPK